MLLPNLDEQRLSGQRTNVVRYASEQVKARLRKKAFCLTIVTDDGGSLEPHYLNEGNPVQQVIVNQSRWHCVPEQTFLPLPKFPMTLVHGMRWLTTPAD